MTLGGSWIFCADDTGANAELVVTRTDKDGAEKQETFHDKAAMSRLRSMLALDKKRSDICGYYDGILHDDCIACPVGKELQTGEYCAHWLDTRIDRFFDIYEEWGKTHGSNVQSELGDD